MSLAAVSCLVRPRILLHFRPEWERPLLSVTFPT
jgi:hypothetical protein